ncbi:MAG: helix-turn-helix domain-containing protein [Pseudomonadota bacterium]
MDRARDMLIASDAPLAEIAFATGFSSQSHLSTAFKKRTGESPRAFRLRAR